MTMNAKKWIQMAAIGSILTTASFLAQATCVVSSGQIVRVSVSPGSSSSYVYIRPDSLSTYYYQGTTTDQKMTNAAVAAVDKQVYIYGDASSCPTTGTSRYMGQISYLAIKP